MKWHGVETGKARSAQEGIERTEGSANRRQAMNKMNMAVLTGLLAFAGAANATLLIEDTFNSTGINTDLATRQTGSLATKTWAYASNYSSTLTMDGSVVNFYQGDGGSSKMAKLSLDHDFTDASIVSGGGFIVSYRVDPAGRSEMAFGLKASGTRNVGGDNTEFEDKTAEVDYRVTLLDTSWEVYGGGTSRLANGSLGGGYYNVDVVVATTGFSLGTPFAATLFIDSVQLHTYNGTWDVDGSNYIAFGQNDSASRAYYDSFSVSAIPEPATFGIVLSALVAAVIRRRRIG
jgi:hypothetical protein